ncbi:MAG: FecR domain-containing protein [Archangiaceae bacterium]|nr:FecR domain-containing protein [Archangiaceae bacterium]
MKPDEFGEELRALDQEFEARGMPADVDARLRARLERPARRVPWVPLVLATTAAALIAFVLLSTPTKVGGLVVEQSSGFSARFEDRVISVKEGTATLKDTELAASMSVQPGVELERYPSGAKVHHGRVHFEVARLSSRTAGYSVSVSHGVIEVMGTSFVIQQGADSGSVHLLEGSIRFIAPDGRVVKLAPGDTLQWPLPPVTVEAPPPVEPPIEKPRIAPRPTPAPVEPKPIEPVTQPAPPFSSEAVLARVAGLRSRRAYEEAVQVLNAALSEAPNAATRERLGFELGSLLTHQLHDVPRACAFWSSFRREHPHSRYDEELTSTVATLGCEK